MKTYRNIGLKSVNRLIIKDLTSSRCRVFPAGVELGYILEKGGHKSPVSRSFKITRNYLGFKWLHLDLGENTCHSNLLTRHENNHVSYVLWKR